jgi:hypothetical protein
MKKKQILDLMEAYASVYENLSESHFKVGDEVICKASGTEGEVIKLDKPHGKDDEKYYTVKHEDGKTMKYSANELKLDKGEENEDEEKKDMKEAKTSGASKANETKFHKKLDKLVHNTFGQRPEEKKMKEDLDIFDYVLEYLVSEGYADTNESAIVIMSNMSEEWRQSIIEKNVSYSAKAARLGKDIGKPGKQFEKISKEAGERYGSKERGEKVAGAVLAKLRAKRG